MLIVGGNGAYSLIQTGKKCILWVLILVRVPTIFLSSGQLDLWRAAGIQEKPKGSPDSIVVRIIENGAHHLDLRAANSLDPPSVVAVRNKEELQCGSG